MTPEEYLRIVSQQIQGFSPAEQAALLEEIGSHIESQNDVLRSAGDPAERSRRMMSELGSPQEMGQRFKMIYRPDRFIEFLFVAIPYALYPFVAAWLERAFGFEFVVRGEVILYALLILIGLWRRSILVTLFWTTLLVGQIIAMLLAGYSFYGRLQSMLWLAFAFGLLLLAGQIVWQSRHDLLTVLFGCLPLLLCAYGSTLVLIHPASAGSRLGRLDLLLLELSSIGGGYFDYFGHLLALAFFFLATQRELRWLSLVFLGSLDTLGRYYLGVSDQLLPPWVYSLYVSIPPVVVLFGWWVERNRRSQIRVAA